MEKLLVLLQDVPRIELAEPQQDDLNFVYVLIAKSAKNLQKTMLRLNA
jgi:hypothetical protein